VLGALPHVTRDLGDADLEDFRKLPEQGEAQALILPLVAADRDRGGVQFSASACWDMRRSRRRVERLFMFHLNRFGSCLITTNTVDIGTTMVIYGQENKTCTKGTADERGGNGRCGAGDNPGSHGILRVGVRPLDAACAVLHRRAPRGWLIAIAALAASIALISWSAGSVA